MSIPSSPLESSATVAAHSSPLTKPVSPLVAPHSSSSSAALLQTPRSSAARNNASETCSPGQRAIEEMVAGFWNQSPKSQDGSQIASITVFAPTVFAPVVNIAPSVNFPTSASGGHPRGGGKRGGVEKSPLFNLIAPPEKRQKTESSSALSETQAEAQGKIDDLQRQLDSAKAETSAAKEECEQVKKKNGELENESIIDKKWIAYVREWNLNLTADQGVLYNEFCLATQEIQRLNLLLSNVSSAAPAQRPPSRSSPAHPAQDMVLYRELERNHAMIEALKGQVQNLRNELAMRARRESTPPQAMSSAAPVRTFQEQTNVETLSEPSLLEQLRALQRQVSALWETHTDPTIRELLSGLGRSILSLESEKNEKITYSVIGPLMTSFEYIQNQIAVNNATPRPFSQRQNRNIGGILRNLPTTAPAVATIAPQGPSIGQLLRDPVTARGPVAPQGPSSQQGSSEQTRFLTNTEKKDLLQAIEASRSSLRGNCSSARIRNELDRFRQTIGFYNAIDPLSKAKSELLIKEFKSLREEASSLLVSGRTSSDPVELID